MKIAKLYIKGFRQFQNIELDFTNPSTGRAVDKVCFIGKNGSGKTTLLELIWSIIPEDGKMGSNRKQLRLVEQIFGGDGKYRTRIDFLLIQVEINRESYWVLRTEVGFQREILLRNNFMSTDLFKLLVEIESEGQLIELLNFQDGPFGDVYATFKEYELNQQEALAVRSKMFFKPNENDLCIYSACESFSNNLKAMHDVPDANLDQALNLFKNFPTHHEVDESSAREFWKTLVYLIKKRQNDREHFENSEVNIEKSKRQLIEEFDKREPSILKDLALLWDVILKPLGLHFAYEDAKEPIQLNDNLKAYIKSKSGDQIAYNQLSSGVRSFLFRVGHIYTLYFNRNIERGVLLIDEPENSLFPDFLFQLVEIYEAIVQQGRDKSTTQMFLATHSPIIAAQFEPFERIILDLKENGTVKSRKGVTPVGDDPNDILRQDFGLPNLMGEKGQAAWKEYLDLKRKAREATSPEERLQYVKKSSEIGDEYNF